MKKPVQEQAPARLALKELATIENRFHKMDLSDPSKPGAATYADIYWLAQSCEKQENHRPILFRKLPEGLNTFARAAYKAGQYTPAELANESYFWSLLAIKEIAYVVAVDASRARNKKNAEINYPKPNSRREFERGVLGRLLMCYRASIPVYDKLFAEMDAGNDISELVDELNSIALCLMLLRDATAQLDRECFDDEDVLSAFVRGYARFCREYKNFQTSELLKELSLNWRKKATTLELGVLPYETLCQMAYEEAVEIATRRGMKKCDEIVLSLAIEYDESLFEKAISPASDIEDISDVPAPQGKPVKKTKHRAKKKAVAKAVASPKAKKGKKGTVTVGELFG